ncbi:MAG: aldehyde dehydrogenase family protein [Acidimicrobiales bacterium]
MAKKPSGKEAADERSEMAEGAAKYESRSPQLPDDVVVSFVEAAPDEVQASFERARSAQAEWWGAPVGSRSKALAQAAELVAGAAGELTDLGVREVGKPRAEMAAEVERGVSILRYYAQAAFDPDGESFPGPDGRSLLLARRRPHGVAGCITPWNFPVAIPLWKAAPALAYGNAVLLKPAPAATAVALRLAELLSDALPGGLFQVVPGDASAGRSVVQLADAVSFTGSVVAGGSVIAASAARGVPVQAEMGGQNASIVFPDADLDAAAATVASAAMGYAGQKCTATSRVIVVGDPRSFEEALVAAVKAMPVGDPSEAATAIGPVIDEPARQAVLAAAIEAERAGGRVLAGGREAPGDGYYVEPTLVGGIGPGHRLAQEEIFGPFAVVLHTGDEEEAVQMANGVPLGLVSAVFTGDLDRALRVSSRLDTGLVRVNAATSGVDFYAPFGGTKGSSYGPREQGRAAREFYTWSQTLTIAPARSR